jgi:UDP-N-acetylmuramoyl-L-alanyl-D-glutamate--2,6-diaminopimelate ligase
MIMKLRQLVRGVECEVEGSREVVITGICSDSKRVAPGNLFVARKGKKFDGRVFIPDAIASGAVAVLSDRFDPFLKGVTQIVHPDLFVIEPILARRFYPVGEEFVPIGVTGTNGKTTTTYLIHHIMESVGMAWGMMGTIECCFAGKRFPSTHTTADLFTCSRFLHEMEQSGCRGVAMEVASHALDQGRVRGIDFQIGIFTNLTQDHLDYHQTMENYGKTKAQLFSSLKASGCAVVNGDDPWAKKMVEGCPADVVTYGLGEGVDLRAEKVELRSNGTDFVVRGTLFHSPLIGKFNVYNVLAAIGAALRMGIPSERIAAALQTFPGVRGRLERVENRKGISIVVDYAHTDDALRNVLSTLRGITTGKLIVVSGAGGDKDKGKRPKMGAVMEQLADLAIITSDNPRSEDPQTISNEILGGFKKPEEALVVLDRGDAIARAVDLAVRGDVILIAGKGHETTQVFAHKTIHFDDREAALAAC